MHCVVICCTVCWFAFLCCFVVCTSPTKPSWRHFPILFWPFTDDDAYEPFKTIFSRRLKTDSIYYVVLCDYLYATPIAAVCPISITQSAGVFILCKQCGVYSSVYFPLLFGFLRLTARQYHYCPSCSVTRHPMEEINQKRPNQTRNGYLMTHWRVLW